MANSTWPGDLPQSFNMDGFDQTWADEVERTQTETGPGKVRRRGPNVSQINGSMYLTRAQISSLKTFYFTTLLSGSLKFDWTTQLPEDAAATAYTYRFAKPPSFRSTQNTDMWLVQLQLEKMP